MADVRRLTKAQLGTLIKAVDKQIANMSMEERALAWVEHMMDDEDVRIMARESDLWEFELRIYADSLSTTYQLYDELTTNGRVLLPGERINMDFNSMIIHTNDVRGFLARVSAAGIDIS